jgi:hypothetical protein
LGTERVELISGMDPTELDKLQAIFTEIKCPICQDYMLPPIFVVCKSGHSVCSRCAEQLKERCPLCKQPVVNIRNIVMEKVATRIRYPCVNRKCICSFTIDDIIGHQAGCFYSNRKCPLSAVSETFCETCDWTGETSQLKEHFSSIHKCEIKEVPDRQRYHRVVCFYERKALYPDRIIATLGEIFLQCAVLTGNTFYCIVQYVGRKDDANKYNYKVSVSCKQGCGEFSVSHVVSSDTDDLHKIRERADCVHIPGDFLKNYCTIDNVKFPLLSYSVEISKHENTDA